MKIRLLMIALVIRCLHTCCWAEEIYPIGRFDWPVSACEVKDGDKDGKYKCAMFVKQGEAQKQFLLWYEDGQPEEPENEPKISLDRKTALRDAALSIQFDFSRPNPDHLHRPSFIVPKIQMKQATTYEATVYVKSEVPDAKIRIALMGNFTIVGKERMHGIYKFSDYTASTMWQPFTATLRTDMRKDVASAVINYVAVQFNTPGVYHVGSVSIREVPDLKPQDQSQNTEKADHE